MTPLHKLALATEPIRLRDPLAEFLGFREIAEPFEFTLEDAGRFAGHLCPTVATAFTATRIALQRLYQGALPERGGLRVTMASAPDQFANGPLARVAAYITGAAGDDGFRGLAGRFSRQHLLVYEPKLEPYGSIWFQRLDTGAKIGLLPLPERIQGGGGMAQAMKPALEGDPQQAQVFQQAWQQRIESVLQLGDQLFRIVS
jgi:hypothetical protein